MQHGRDKAREWTLFAILGLLGIAAALFHVNIPHTDVLIDGRWGFGFLGFALLSRWWAALALAALLSYPYGTPDIPLWIGFCGNMLYALPSLLVIRTASGWMQRRLGHGWFFGLGWLVLVLLCYQVFITPVVWGVIALLQDRPLAAGLAEGWRSQPFLVESILVAWFSALAMVAALSVERLRAQRQRLEHIRNVLLGIRNVNQLIVTETDPERLIERACANLTETMGYRHAQIVLLGGEAGRSLGLVGRGELAATASAGLADGLETIRERLERGAFPVCMKHALETDEILVIETPAAECSECPLHELYADHAGLERRLALEGVTYGILTAYIPRRLADDAEERQLFDEVAGDLAFALHKMAGDRREQDLQRQIGPLRRRIPDLETALEESERNFGTLAESAPVGVYMNNARGETIYVNQKCADLVGGAAEQLLKFGWISFLHPDDRDRMVREWEKAVENSSEFHLEYRWVHSDGRVVWTLGQVTPILGEDGKAVRFVGTLTDISAVKQAEEALRESEQRLLLAARSASLGIWDWDIVHDNMTWDDQMFRLYGIAQRPETYGVELWKEYLHPEDMDFAWEACEAALRGDKDYEIEFRVCRPDGTVGHISGHGIVLRNDAGEPVRMLGINLDITARKEAEQALRAEERRNQALLDHSPACHKIVDLDLNLQYMSRNGFKMLQLDETADVYGKPYPFEFFPEAFRRGMRERLEQVKAGGSTLVFEALANDIRGKGVWLHSTLVPVFNDDAALDYITVVSADLTQEKKLENDLLQSQKMESVGRLAGGVAHDFNNMLNVILGHAELACDDLAPESPLRADLDEIRKAAQRSANLTRQLLAFARKQTVAPRVLDLNETIASMIRMLERLIGEDINLLWKPATRLARVRIDPGQVDQMLANLTVNARDAIGRQSGRVTIETAAARFDEEYCRDHPGFLPGDYVMLSVGDDGCGMDEETRTHIFEPFFTTKGVSEGTGLGLATVYGIVKQNRGFIQVYSEPDKGTVFRIYLPALAGEDAGQDEARTLEATPAGGNETILLVEDEAAILNMTRSMLERKGYKVLSAARPSEALRMVGEQALHVDLIVTDVVMPEMYGRDLAARLREHFPKARILFMSGYTADVIAHQGVLDEGVNFLQKPFSARDLAAQVRRVLDS